MGVRGFMRSTSGGTNYITNPLNPNPRDFVLDKVTEIRNMTSNQEMKIMGMLNVLCECHVYVPEAEQESIQYAVEDNLPDGWRVKRILDRLELVPPEPVE